MGHPLTYQFCTQLQSGGRKVQKQLQVGGNGSQQPCWDTPYRKWSERRGGHCPLWFRAASGLLSRE